MKLKQHRNYMYYTDVTINVLY